MQDRAATPIEEEHDTHRHSGFDPKARRPLWTEFWLACSDAAPDVTHRIGLYTQIETATTG